MKTGTAFCGILTEYRSVDVMKTRAWDGERFRNDYAILPDGSIWETYVEDLELYGIQLIEKVNWKLSRFTGLLDKNTNEIYEDHIVKVWLSNVYYVVGTVKWHNGTGCMHNNGFVIERKDNKYEYIMGGHDDNELMAIDIEVIGNVFQNPELLEVK